MKNLIGLTMSVTFLVGCASSYKLPTSRIMMPENNGESKMSIVGGLHAQEDITLTTNIGNVPVASSSHAVVNETTIGGLFMVGLKDYLDLGVVGDIGSPIIFQGKLQFLGDPFSTADAGNISLALTAGLGFSWEVDKDRTFSTSTSSGEISKKQNSIFQYGLIFGYRISKEFLLLAGTSYSSQSTEGIQTLSNSTTELPYQDDAIFKEVHIGLQCILPSSDRNKFWFQPIVSRGSIQTFGKVEADTLFTLDFGTSF